MLARSLVAMTIQLFLLLQVILGLTSHAVAQSGLYQQCGGIGWSVIKSASSTEHSNVSRISFQDGCNDVCKRQHLHPIEQLCVAGYHRNCSDGLTILQIISSVSQAQLAPLYLAALLYIVALLCPVVRLHRHRATPLLLRLPMVLLAVAAAPLYPLPPLGLLMFHRSGLPPTLR